MGGSYLILQKRLFEQVDTTRCDTNGSDISSRCGTATDLALGPLEVRWLLLVLGGSLLGCVLLVGVRAVVIFFFVIVDMVVVALTNSAMRADIKER